MSTQGQSIAEANDWMALEPRLVELARAAVEGVKPAVHVLTHADLAAVAETAQKTPAVHVIYGGYRVAESLGIAWRLAHTWYVVAAVRNVAAIGSGQPARLGAGNLLARVTGRLVGQKLEGATTPLQLISPPSAQYRDGFQYIPSAFEVETIFRKPQ